MPSALESTCLGILLFTVRLTAAAVESTSTYPQRDARRVRFFSCSLGPSPRRLTLVWPRRDAPPADSASGAKQRRYAAVSPSNSSTVVLLLAVVDN